MIDIPNLNYRRGVVIQKMDWDFFRLAERIEVKWLQHKLEGEGISQLPNFNMRVYVYTTTKTERKGSKLALENFEDSNGSTSSDERAKDSEEKPCQRSVNGMPMRGENVKKNNEAMNSTGTNLSTTSKQDQPDLYCSVFRYFHDLCWLWDVLTKQYPHWILPGLPGNTLLSTFTDEKKLSSRSRWCEDSMHLLIMEHIDELRKNRTFFEFLALQKMDPVQMNYLNLEKKIEKDILNNSIISMNRIYSLNNTLLNSDVVPRPSSCSTTDHSFRCLKLMLNREKQENKGDYLRHNVMKSVKNLFGFGGPPSGQNLPLERGSVVSGSAYASGLPGVSLMSPPLVVQQGPYQGEQYASSTPQGLSSLEALSPESRREIPGVDSEVAESQIVMQCGGPEILGSAMSFGTAVSSSSSSSTGQDDIYSTVDIPGNDRFIIEEEWLRFTEKRTTNLLKLMQFSYSRILEWRDVQTEIGLLCDKLTSSRLSVLHGDRYRYEIENFTLYPLERITKTILNAKEVLKKRNAYLNLVKETREILKLKVKAWEKLNAINTASINPNQGDTGLSNLGDTGSSNPSAAVCNVNDVHDQPGEHQQQFPHSQQSTFLLHQVNRWKEVLRSNSKVLKAYDGMLESELINFQCYVQETTKPLLENWESSLKKFGKGIAGT